MTKFARAGLPALLALALLADPAFAQTDGGAPAGTKAATPGTQPEGKPAAAPAGAPAASSNEAGKVFDLPRVGDKSTQIKLISGLCGVQMKAMSAPACTCLAEQALTGLSDPQRDYMIATVVAPPVAERMLNDGRVGQPDQATIFAFINATSEACASGTFDATKAKAAAAAATAAPTAPAAVPAAPAVSAPPASAKAAD